MKEVVEVCVDTFKYGFSALFNSVEDAVVILPTLEEFKKAAPWFGPYPEDGWIKERNYKLIQENDIIKVFIDGDCWVRAEYKEFPEVKIPGEPYQEARREKIREYSSPWPSLVGVIHTRTLPVYSAQERKGE